MILNIQEIVLDQCLDPGVLAADPEPGAAEQPRQRSAQDRRGLPGADRRHLHARWPRRRPRARRPTRSRPSAATSSASTSSGSARWSWARRTSSLFGSYGFVIVLGRSSSVPPDAKNLAQASPRGDRPEDRQAPRAEGPQIRRYHPGPPQGDPLPRSIRSSRPG